MFYNKIYLKMYNLVAVKCPFCIIADYSTGNCLYCGMRRVIMRLNCIFRNVAFFAGSILAVLVVLTVI